MTLDFSYMHFYIMASISRAVLKTYNLIKAPITPEYEGNTLYLVMEGKIIGEKSFDSQEQMELFCKDGRRNYHFYRKVIRTYLPGKEYDRAPSTFKVNKETQDFFEQCQEFFEKTDKIFEEHRIDKEAFEREFGESVDFELNLIKRDLRDLLGLAPDFDFKDIRRPYRKFMQQNHPDKNPDADKELVSRLNSLMDRYTHLVKSE